MQPFPTYQNFGYQPQYGGYQQYNPLQPQYDRLAQMQTQYNQQQLYNQPVQQAQTPGLNGEIVDGLDVVIVGGADEAVVGDVHQLPAYLLSKIRFVRSICKKAYGRWNKSDYYI